MADILIAQGVQDMMFQVILWAQYFIGAAMVYYFVRLFTVEKNTEPEGIHAGSPGAVKHVAGGVTDLVSKVFGSEAADMLQYKVWGKNAQDYLHIVDSELSILAARHRTLDDAKKGKIVTATKSSVDAVLSLKGKEMKKVTAPTVRTHIQNQLKLIAGIEEGIGSSPKEPNTLRAYLDAASKAKPSGKSVALGKIDTLLKELLEETRDVIKLETAIEAELKKAAP